MDLNKLLLPEYSTDEVKVYIVNGEHVRTNLDIEFTMGGHDLVYDYIPHEEIWIDDAISPEARPFTVFHELHEHSLMADGMTYDEAHALASIQERIMRDEPKQLPGAIAALLRSIKSIRYAVKFIDEEQGIIEGMGIPYGGPLRSDEKELGRDLQGEFFSPKTDFRSEYYDGKKLVKSMPSLYHHGLDPELGDEPIGQVTEIDDAPGGKWFRAQLDKANRYYEQIKLLVKMGRLKFSSGAVPELVVKARDGFIERWPVRELSFTPSAANPIADIANFKSLTGGINIKEDTKLSDIRKNVYQFGNDAVTGADVIRLFQRKGASGALLATLEEKLEHAQPLTGSVKTAEINELTGKYQSKRVGDLLALSEKWYGVPAAKTDNEGLPAVEFHTAPSHADPAASAIAGDQSKLAEDGKPATSSGGPGNVTTVAPPPEQAVKAIQLPAEVIQALQTLQQSVTNILSQAGGAPAPAAPQAEPPKEGQPSGDKPTQVSNPGVSQGMAPETHKEPNPAAPNNTPASQEEEEKEEKPEGQETTVVKTEEKPNNAQQATCKENEPEPPKTETRAADNVKSLRWSPEQIAAAQRLFDEATKGMKLVSTDTVNVLVASAVKSVVDEVKGTLTELKGRIETLEKMPAADGPVRRAIKSTNPHMELSAEDKGPIRAEVINDLLSNPNTPQDVKSWLGEQSALDDVRNAMAGGPVPIRRK